MAKSKGNTLQEVFGEEFFSTHVEKQEILPTGSVALDVSTGVGGFPFGRFINIYGPEASGKTTLCLTTAKEALSRGKKVLYIDIEQTLDDELVSIILGDLWKGDNFVISRPEIAEQAFLMAEHAINNKEYDVIIFDSVGALAPQKELEDDFADPHMALVARLSTTFHKRNGYLIRKNNILFIFINQVRAKIGGSFLANAVETPGGYAMKHYSSITISLFPGKKIPEKDPKPFGIHIKFTVTKNKVGPPYRSAEFPIIWGVGLDKELDVLEFANMLGVVGTRGPYKVFREETVGLGWEKSLERLKNDKELLDKIVKECYNAVGVTNLLTKGHIFNNEEADIINEPSN